MLPKSYIIQTVNKSHRSSLWYLRISTQSASLQYGHGRFCVSSQHVILIYSYSNTELFKQNPLDSHGKREKHARYTMPITVLLVLLVTLQQIISVLLVIHLNFSCLSGFKLFILAFVAFSISSGASTGFFVHFVYTFLNMIH